MLDRRKVYGVIIVIGTVAIPINILFSHFLESHTKFWLNAFLFAVVYFTILIFCIDYFLTQPSEKWLYLIFLIINILLTIAFFIV